MRPPILFSIVWSLAIWSGLSEAGFHLLILDSGLAVDGQDNGTSHHAGGDGGGVGGVRKRQADPGFSRYSDDTPATIENTLNQLRRKVLASDMNYANWNNDLQTAASALVTECRLQTESAVDPSEFLYVEGVTGILQLSSSVSVQLQSAYNMGSAQSAYRVLMSSRMTQFGCAVGSNICVAVDQYRRSFPVRIFACIFSYNSDPNSVPVYKSGLNCSSCDSGTLWCDGGLCRGSCGVYNPTCDDCVDTCTGCAQVTSNSKCQCVCYYGNNSPARCQGVAYSSDAQPFCKYADDNYRPAVPVGWIACIIISSAVLLSLAISVAIWQCFRRRLLLRRQQRQATEGNAQTGISSVCEQFGPDFVPVMSPPSYVEVAVKPPPYELSGGAPPYVASGAAQPSAPDEASNKPMVVVESHIYDNVACTGDDTHA
jgi:hypothetical protein